MPIFVWLILFRQGQIRLYSSLIDAIGEGYIILFIFPHKKKSHDVELQERAGQAAGPPLIIQFFERSVFKYALNLLESCVGTNFLK